jgi:hypothetical protein
LKRGREGGREGRRRREEGRERDSFLSEQQRPSPLLPDALKDSEGGQLGLRCGGGCVAPEQQRRGAEVIREAEHETQ